MAGSSSKSGGKQANANAHAQPTTQRKGRKQRKLATEQGQDPLSGQDDPSDNSTVGTENGGANAGLSPGAEQAQNSFKDGDRPLVYEHGVNVAEEHIADALAVAEIDTDLYKSVSLWRPSRARGVFGGQVIAQALAAASQTVREGIVLHSMHCYFLLAGDATFPILYHVNRVRDGGSYVTRSVKATQRAKTIFILFSSYQKPEPKQPSFAIPLPGDPFKAPTVPGGLNEHKPAITWTTEELISHSNAGFTSSSAAPAAPPAPPKGDGSAEKLDWKKLMAATVVPPEAISQAQEMASSQSWSDFVAQLRTPEESPPNEERYIQVLSRHGSALPEAVVSSLNAWINDRRSSAVEIRDALPCMYDENTGLPTPGSGQAFWMRTREEMKGGPEGQKHALAYASDFYLLSSIPKALGVMSSLKMMASLDHSMWFYESFDVHDWILYVMQTQAASNGRGVALGRLYRRDGTLVAVVAQEGMVRAKFDDNDSKL